jgi:thiol-disulfide isomerase/thioredoxin
MFPENPMPHFFRAGLIILAIVVTIIAGCGPSTTSEAPSIPTGVRKGNKSIQLIAQDVQGNMVYLNSFQGKVVMLNFWATWCSPCVSMIPHEKEIAQKYQNRPFVILGISADHERQTLHEFLTKNEIKWPTFHDNTSSLRRNWEINSIPTILLIDHERIIQERFEGIPQPLSTLDQAIETLVKQAEAK